MGIFKILEKIVETPFSLATDIIKAPGKILDGDHRDGGLLEHTSKKIEQLGEAVDED